MPEYVYDEATAVRYDAAVPVLPNEVEFYLEMAQHAREAGLRTLELAAGTGRIAIPLARAGIPIVGLDNSAAMLAAARAKSAGLDNVDWVEGDMRSFDLGEQFGLIFIAAGTLQLLLSVDDHLACLSRARDHLVPGGRLAFEVENLDIKRVAEWMTARAGTFARRPQRDYVHPETGRRIVTWGNAAYHPSEQRYTQYGMHDELDDEGRVVERFYGQPMELRYFHRYEVEHLLARCGFEVEALYGDLTKSPYRGDSPDMIWQAVASGR